MHRSPARILAGFLLLGASMAAADPSPCKPAVWADAMAKFEQQDAAEPPPHDAVLFVGSSSIVMWDVAKWFPELTTINRGFGGSQICDSTHYAELLVAKHQPRVIVFYAGDNDIASGKTPEQVHADFRAFVTKVRESLRETPIVFISIKPSIARWKLADAMRTANRLIAADCAADKSLRFVDVWPAMLGEDGQPRPDIFREDGLHMNDAGYTLWTELVGPLVKRAESTARHP